MCDAGLPREARLRRAADFAALRHSAGRLSSGSFRIRFGSNEAGVARLGLAISKRVSKRAVDRNRIKRVIRESFRHARLDLPAVDILVMARESARDADLATLRDELTRLWKKLSTLKVPPRPGKIAR